MMNSEKLRLFDGLNVKQSSRHGQPVFSLAALSNCWATEFHTEISHVHADSGHFYTSFFKFMNLIKKTAVILSMACAFGVASTPVVAEEAAVTETIAQLEKAAVEINKSDFNNALVLLKAAKNSSSQITSTNEAKLKSANNSLVQSLTQVKKGEVKGASSEITKAIAEYKAL
jgi:hypothetical protein